MTAPEIVNTTDIDIPAHKVLLEFNSDADAEAWLAWWYNQGVDLFEDNDPGQEESW